MKNVCFFLDNTCISSVDASHIADGNPGMGGTEYLILLMSYLLSTRDNNIQVHLYTTRAQKLPSEINYRVVEDIDHAISLAQQNETEYFIAKHDVEFITKKSFEKTQNLKFIIWCHVFVCYWELDYYAKNSNIAKIVYVGREMRDLYRDHSSFSKSVYIYNCVIPSPLLNSVKLHPFSKRKNIVTYVGSIVPYKGFHLLAKAWPEVLKEVPDAELYVIGSGKLYNDQCILGKVGIAEKEYEDIFLKHISKNGEVIPSVHFMGKMGTEKEEILLKTKVGVPNPSGITETFCLSAVEMQMMGATVTTIKAPGYLDTVINGLLYKNEKDLSKAIVKQLKTNYNNYEKALDYFEKNFSCDAVAKRWEDLIRTGKVDKDHRLHNTSYRLKWMKEFIRKSHIGFHILPPIERFLIFWERKILKKITFMDSNMDCAQLR